MRSMFRTFSSGGVERIAVLVYVKNVGTSATQKMPNTLEYTSEYSTVTVLFYNLR
jgi:hypothetical protein